MALLKRFHSGEIRYAFGYLPSPKPNDSPTDDLGYFPRQTRWNNSLAEETPRSNPFRIGVVQGAFSVKTLRAKELLRAQFSRALSVSAEYSCSKKPLAGYSLREPCQYLGTTPACPSSWQDPSWHHFDRYSSMASTKVLNCSHRQDLCLSTPNG